MNRHRLLTSRWIAARSSESARPKVWRTWARAKPLLGSRTLWASWTYNSLLLFRKMNCERTYFAYLFDTLSPPLKESAFLCSKKRALIPHVLSKPILWHIQEAGRCAPASHWICAFASTPIFVVSKKMDILAASLTITHARKLGAARSSFDATIYDYHVPLLSSFFCLRPASSMLGVVFMNFPSRDTYKSLAAYLIQSSAITSSQLAFHLFKYFNPYSLFSSKEHMKLISVVTANFRI